MTQKKGIFIVIDGIDGSGKGTQVELVKHELTKKGKRVALLDFPRYGEQSSFMVRKYLNGEYGSLQEIDAYKASIFYAIDRFDAKKDIEDKLLHNDVVISNRYVSANLIHQAAKLGTLAEVKTYLSWAQELEYGILGLPKPDKTILLAISPQASIAFVEQKQQREYIKNASQKDIHEIDEEFVKKSADRALLVARLCNWVIIPCEEEGRVLAKEIITQHILKKIL